MDALLRYGKTGLPLPIPDNQPVDVIASNPMPPLADAIGAVQEAISGLEAESRDAKRVCIAICDITRPAPNRVVVPALVEACIHGGVKPCDITILIATGLHRPSTDEEIAEMLGDDPRLAGVTVCSHVATDNEEHLRLGTTARGVPIKLDRRFLQADLRIVVGLIEPHFMAGYSGGRKLIAPGIAHADTIRMIHSLRFLGDPNCRNCTLLGNPLHDELCEIAAAAGRVFAVNTIINDHRELVFVNFGEILASHAEAVSALESYVHVPVPAPYDVVVTSAGGYPLDKTYYQTVKGMVGVLDILAPGGEVLIVSACSEGLGSPAYVRAQRRLVQRGMQAFLAAAARKPRADIDEWETVMQTKVMRAGRVSLYAPDLPANLHMLTGVTRVDSPDAWLQARADRQHRVAVIPEGPYVIPYIAETVRV